MELDTKNQLQRCDGNGERKEHVIQRKRRKMRARAK